MNRTRSAEAYDLSTIADEDIFVVSGFTHPTRGRVLCPAAPLIAAWLAGQGCPSPVREFAPGTIGRPSATIGSARSGVLAMTTYLDLDGRAVGIAVAGGSQRAELAEDVVRRWSRTLRTRRALVALTPRPCGYGRGGRPPLPERRGAERDLGNDDEEVCRAARTADATIRAYLGRGDTVLLLGHRDDRRRPEPAGSETVPRPAGSVVEVGGPEAVAGLEVKDEARLSFVVRPCTVVEEIIPLLRELRGRYPELRGQHPDQWCYVASDARWAYRAVAEASDLTLLTGKAEPHPAVLAGGGSLRRIRSLAELLPDEIAPAATVGLVATDDGLAEADQAAATVTDVLEVLAGLGPLSVVHRRVRTDVSTNIYENA
ncbi:hypothetical protein, partial [Kitasatospora purpeofusca]|uniref:hypothetical protein n=1 Tax=Kitasatospora purpeofusca TaxID=67352 RepID=UPI00386E1F03